MTVLALEDVLLTAAGGIEVLRRISFSVARGRIMGLVGESGAGKSMVGKLISGLLPENFRVASGRLLFEGKDLVGQPPAARRRLLGRRIAFIPQEPLSALDPVLTVGKQFAEHLARLGVRRRELAGRAEAWLEAVHLPEPAKMLRRYPYELSGGQCQRVLIAMAFSSEPALIVADEPTTALDVITQSRILSLMREQQALHGAAVVLITHDLHLAAQVCDEVGVLYAGDMVETGPAREVLQAPFHPYTRSLRSSTPAIAGPRRVLPALPDQMPGVMALAKMPGCRFAPRCPTRNAACAADLPRWRTVAEGHRVRCADACIGADFAPPDDVAMAGSPATDAPLVLELRGVSLRYPGRKNFFRHATGVDAVRDVSLCVRSGEFVGIVGESGSGKSSVARLVMGLEQPTAGEIVLEGGAQIVFQDPQSALNPRRRVFSLVTQALEVAGHHVDSGERLRRALDLLEETGLPADCLPRVPSQLSGGQKQRVNIARALCVTPLLLVADEVVSGLDVSVQAQILNLLLRLGRELEFSLLFISHDLAVVRYLCTRVAVMHRGRIVESGDTEEVFANPQHEYTRSLIAAVPSGTKLVAASGYEPTIRNAK